MSTQDHAPNVKPDTVALGEAYYTLLRNVSRISDELASAAGVTSTTSTVQRGIKRARSADSQKRSVTPASSTPNNVAPVQHWRRDLPLGAQDALEAALERAQTSLAGDLRLDNLLPAMLALEAALDRAQGSPRAIRRAQDKLGAAVDELERMRAGGS
ncbi:unnamed protein product [Cutaneotrichosporon oleaginosum]